MNMTDNFVQQQDRATTHQHVPVPSLSKLGSFSILFLLFCAILAIASWIVSHDYMIDWDTLRYAINVKIAHKGDTFFSYPHNLLKTCLFSLTTLIEVVTGQFEPLYAANILTVFSSVCSSFFLLLITKKLTENLFFSLLAALLWFLIPVNCYHILLLEDNVWANAFNTLSMYLMLLLYIVPGVSQKRKIVLSVLCGLVLSIGINIHQQLVPVFYLFLLASVFFFYRNKALLGKVLISFLVSYFLCSFIQNYLSFGKVEMLHTVRRLFQQPYAKVFPQIWFFSSDDTLLQWAGKILDGLKNSFFFGGKDIPVIFLLLIPLTLFVCLQVVFKQIKEKKLISLSFQIILFLFAATFIHVPHTLVYEPWNPERWDVITPSFIVLLVYSLYTFSLQIESWKGTLKSFVYLSTFVIVSILLVLTANQNYTYFTKIITWFQQSEANRSFPGLASYLAAVKNNSKNNLKDHIVLLPPAMRWFGFEERVTYYFPNFLAVTLDNNLDIVYSSAEQQFWNKPFAKTSFPENKFQPKNTFHIMPTLWKDFKKAAPVFLKEHDVHLIPIDEYK